MRSARFVGALVLLGLLGVCAAAHARDQRPTVAVLYFDYDGADEDMGFLRKGLAQMLVTDLIGVAEIQVVERARLEEVLAELELNRSNKIDKRSATRIGKLLGARFLVMGGYFDLKGTLRIDARVIDVETGKVLHSVGASRKAEEFMALEQQLGEQLGAFLASELPARKAVKPSKKPKPAARRHARKAPATARRSGAARPEKLHARTVARYGKALDELDRGNERAAREQLQAIVDEQPDFGVAALDLKKLAK